MCVCDAHRTHTTPQRTTHMLGNTMAGALGDPVESHLAGGHAHDRTRISRLFLAVEAKSLSADPRGLGPSQAGRATVVPSKTRRRVTPDITAASARCAT